MDIKKIFTNENIKNIINNKDNIKTISDLIDNASLKDNNNDDKTIDGKLSNVFNKIVDINDKYNRHVKTQDEVMKSIDKSENVLLLKVPSMTALEGIAAIDDDNSLFKDIAKIKILKSLYDLKDSKNPEAIQDLFFGGIYIITDLDGNIKYHTDSSRTILYDTNDKELGNIKEHPISFGLFEKETKKCTVYIGKKKRYLVHGGKEYFDKTRSVSIEEYNDNNTIRYSTSNRLNEEGNTRISIGNKKYIKINKFQIKASKGYTNKYTITVDEKDEVIAILLVLAIDMVG